MKLMLFIGNDCIDSVEVEQGFITFPGYIGHFVRLLKKNNEQLLLQMNGESEFLLHDISTVKLQQVIKMNENYLESLHAPQFKRAV